MVVEDLDEQVPDDLGLAISGGGVRAALLGLGSMLYLVDAGYTERLRSISSVSGGSILNGYVAVRGDVSKHSPEELERQASDFATDLVKRGVTHAALTYLYLGVIVAAAGFLIAGWGFGWPVSLATGWYVVWLVVWLGALALRGVVVERLLDRRFLRGPAGGKYLIGNVDSTVDHVFCATDINAVSPFYFSTWDGGFVYSPFYGAAEDGSTPIAGAVRASAAFPGGIPPKRLRLSRIGLDTAGAVGSWARGRQAPSRRAKRLRARMERSIRKDAENDLLFEHERRDRAREWEKKIAAAERRDRRNFTAYLGDGGIWNNLATQAYLEDGVLRGTYVPRWSKRDVYTGRVGELDPKIDPHYVVVDATLPPSRSRLRWLVVPGLTEMLAFVRSTKVLYNNTVEPRATALSDTGGSGWQAGERPPWVSVSLSESWTESVYRWIGYGDDDPATPAAARAAPLRTVQTRRDAEGRTTLGSDVRELADWELEPTASNLVIPTTLGRTAASSAIDLMVHGYMSTMVQMHIAWNAPLNTDLRIERFERLIR